MNGYLVGAIIATIVRFSLGVSLSNSGIASQVNKRETVAS